MKYEAIIDVARKSVFMPFCTGIRFDMIDGKRWAATLFDRDNVKPDPHGTGATIEEATNVLIGKISEFVRTKRDRATRESNEAGEMERALQTVTGAPK